MPRTAAHVTQTEAVGKPDGYSPGQHKPAGAACTGARGDVPAGTRRHGPRSASPAQAGVNGIITRPWALMKLFIIRY